MSDFYVLPLDLPVYDVSFKREISQTHFFNIAHVDRTVRYGVGTLIVTGKCQGLYILHHGKLTAVGGRFLYARHLENVVFDLGGLPLRP